MNFSERNKKVAIARWKRINELEKTNIKNDRDTLRLKSTLCGFLAGDGSVKKRGDNGFFHYEIKFFPDDGLMLARYLYALHKVYAKTPSIRVEDNVFNVRLTSRVVYEDLTKYSCFGIHDWSVPNDLFKIKGAKEAWLRAFFSAEAYVGPNHIKLQTVNKKGMLVVSQLLNELGIDHRTYYYVPRKKEHSPVSILMITKKQARNLFLKRIGFWHKKKTNALREALDL